MSHQSNRRQFLQTTAATGIGFWVAGGVQAKESKSPNERIAFASIGIGGKGSSDSADAGKSGDMVAICDTDESRLEGAAKRFEKDGKKVKLYTDFRKLLDEMGKSIDAVTVSTPDHTHAPASLMAMRMGKHCFCQKPLTHTIYEARLMGKVAREMKVATEMGNQGTANPALRKASAFIKSGGIGNVKEVHVWTNRPIWPQGGKRPEPAPCPKSLQWDLWLSVAPKRPYANGYHPFAWRGWWDFGTGALGDMACHTVNMPFDALMLRDPTSVQAETSGHNKDSYPKWSIIQFEFPANDKRPGVKMTWYDGGKRPDKALLGIKDSTAGATGDKGKAGKKGGKGKGGNGDFSGSGSLIIGDKATIYAPGDYSEHAQFLNGDPLPDIDFVRSPGHFEEWVRAIKGGPSAVSNFPDYAGPLAETILLGNLAVWAAADGKGEKVLWDATNMKCTNIPGLEGIVKPTYQPGYTLE